MSRAELIEALEGGDIGDVEFMELAFEVGMSIAEIEAALQSAQQNEQFED